MTKTGVHGALAISVVLLLSACGAGQEPCPSAPPRASEEGSTPGASEPGRLDAELVAVAARADGVYRIRVRASETGEIQKFAVYHGDAEEVPEAVRNAARERFPDAEVRHYESEIYSDLGRVFEVEVMTAEGRECEISCRPDGTMVYVECRVPTEEVPEPALAAAGRLLPEGEVVEAETKEGPGIDEVHLEVRVGELIHYLVLQPTGELVRHGLRIPTTIEIPVGQ